MTIARQLIAHCRRSSHVPDTSYKSFIKLHLQLNKVFSFVPVSICMTFTATVRMRPFSKAVYFCFNMFLVRVFFCVLV
jgi:hypothetical protein